MVTDYLMDTQPGLAKLLSDRVNGTTTRTLHGLRGVLMQSGGESSTPAVWGQAVWGQATWGGSAGNNSVYLLEDGLGSIRGLVNAQGSPTETTTYTPFGQPEGTGLSGTDFGFTGEYTDETELLYLRARYMNPTMGGFVSLDPFEGVSARPMSLNGYSWVEGNPIDMIDPSGFCATWDFQCNILADYLQKKYGGNAADYRAQPVTELLKLYYLGGLIDASILPNLAYREDPDLVISAIQYKVNDLLSCDNAVSDGASIFGIGLVTGTSGATVGSSSTLPALGQVAGVGLILGIGISLGLGLLLAVSATTGTSKKRNQDECSKYPNDEVRRCNDPALTENGFVFNSFNSALDNIASRSSFVRDGLAVYSRTGIGDELREGLCSVQEVFYAPYVGKHWNVWGDVSELDQRLPPPQGRNVRPLAAILECKCCNRGQIDSIYAVANSHGRLQ
jgi:RHS repeat-associated protein